MKNISDRLAWARKQKNLTQKELALRAGVAAATIGNVERGASFTMRSILPIAKVLDVNAEWLASGIGEAYAPNAIAPRIYDTDTERVLQLMMTTDDKGRRDILSCAIDVWELREVHLRATGKSHAANEQQRARHAKLNKPAE